MSARFPFLLALLAALPTFAAGVPTLIESVRTNGQIQTRLAWPAEADRQYDVSTSTNLAAGGWWLATNNPIAPTNLIGGVRLVSTNRTQFYRVAPRDTTGPAITYLYPASNAIGVGRFATMTVNVTDETGVNPSRFRLTCNSLTLTNGSPGVSASSNAFLYVPGTNAWGGYGTTSAVSFVCADVLGNTTTSAWTFALELQAVATNVLIHLPPPAGLKNSALAKAAQAKGATYIEGLTIVSFETNFIVFSYSGTNSGLYNGGILVSHDPERCFYRGIMNLVDDATNHMITAYTTNLPLTALVKDGSFSPEVFVTASGAMAVANASLPLGYSLSFSRITEFTLGQFEIGNHVRITPGQLSLNLQGKMEISATIKDWQLATLDASVSSQLAAQLKTKVDVFDKFDFLTWSRTIGEPIVLGHAVGFIVVPLGVVPVWVDLLFAVDLGFEAKAEGAVSFATGYDSYANSDFQLSWRPGLGWNPSSSSSSSYVPVPLDMQFQVSAEAFFYLKPRLSVAVCYIPGILDKGLASATLDYRRGPGLEAKWKVGDPQCEITLFDKGSINAGLTILGVPDGQLPKATLLEEKISIRTWYWPPLTNLAPVFTLQPSNVTAASGSSVTLTASATGSPEPNYQWFQNGQGIPYKTQPTLMFTMGKGAEGSYTVMAKNHEGWTNSSPATVSLQTQPTPPSSMAFISPGSFTMGDSLDSLSSALPLHAVYVSGFYMDRCDVPKALWDDVYNWAITHGYGFNYGAQGKAASHPVQMVTWYDAVKWCNARSEREGRVPAYYTDAGLATRYRTGQVTPFVNWSCGYRLPTEAEWEKAARGGAGGLRFPSGNTLSWYQATYHTYWAGNVPYYPYDVNTTGGDNPAFNDGTTPLTSPVGSLAPNGYGLYDMAGNVGQWCWDWYSSSYYASSPATDPSGPSSSTTRVTRGGSWFNGADACRTAVRGNTGSMSRINGLGFRCVLSAGQ